MKKSKLKVKFLMLMLLSLTLWSLTGYVFTDSSVTTNNNVLKEPSQLVNAFKEINDYVSAYAPGGTVGIAIRDLTSHEYLSINGNIEFNPASVIKVPVMVEAYHQVALGKITLDDMVILKQRNHTPGCGRLYFSRTGSKYSVRTLIDKMITESDNTATNMLIHYLGMEQINNYMWALGFDKTVIRDDTLLCKVPGKHNTTSPDDMLKLLDMMYNGSLVSKDASREMITVMLAQKHKWGIPHYLPESLKIANKTGSVDGVRNDIGIIFAKDKPYIITIFAKKLSSNNQGTIFVRHLSKLVYEKMTRGPAQITMSRIQRKQDS